MDFSTETRVLMRICLEIIKFSVKPDVLLTGTLCFFFFFFRVRRTQFASPQVGKVESLLLFISPASPPAGKFMKGHCLLLSNQKGANGVTVGGRHTEFQLRCDSNFDCWISR